MAASTPALTETERLEFEMATKLIAHPRLAANDNDNGGRPPRLAIWAQKALAREGWGS